VRTNAEPCAILKISDREKERRGEVTLKVPYSGF
jgi:hypothetical protein